MPQCNFCKGSKRVKVGPEGGKQKEEGCWACARTGKAVSVGQLAALLYEGRIHNLGETLARQHGHAGALSFFSMMGDDVRNFWRGIAKQLIDHAKEWEANDGSCCMLSEKEAARLKSLPRVEE